jgi:hypothetical protein
MHSFRPTWGHVNPWEQSLDGLLWWNDSASGLGLAAEGSADQSAEPAAAPEPAQTSDATTTDEPEPAQVEASTADADDDSQDPLDVLTEQPDDDADPQKPADPQRYKQRARKLERQLKKALPVMSALRESGLTVQDLIRSHQELQRLTGMLQGNPRLNALVTGEPIDTPAPRTATPARRDEPTKYPFSTEDEVGQFMRDFHASTLAENRALRDRLDTLERTMPERVGRLEGTLTAQQRTSAIQEWKGLADREIAALKLEPGLVKLVQFAMARTMDDVLAGRVRATPQQAVDHWVAELRKTRGQQDRTAVAAKQRLAVTNDQRPRRPGASSTAPASVRSRAIPRLEEFNRSLARTYGQAS